MNPTTMNELQQCEDRTPACPAWHDVVSRGLRALLVGAVAVGGVVFVGAFALAGLADPAPAMSPVSIELPSVVINGHLSDRSPATACPVPTDPQSLDCPLPTGTQD